MGIVILRYHFTAPLRYIPEKCPDSLPEVLKAAREAVARAETSSLPTMLRATATGSPERLNSEMMNDAGIFSR